MKTRDFLSGLVVGSLGTLFFTLKEPKENYSSSGVSINSDKFRDRYNLMLEWMTVKVGHQNLGDKLIEHGYHTIAVYGMGEIGNLLYQELKESDAEVLYVIDQGSVYANVEVKTLEDSWEKVDAILITVPYAVDEIREKIISKCDYPVLSMSEVIRWN